MEQRLPEEKRSGKKLLQIKCRTFSGPAVAHAHTITDTHNHTQTHTSFEGIPKSILLDTRSGQCEVCGADGGPVCVCVCPFTLVILYMKADWRAPLYWVHTFVLCVSEMETKGREIVKDPVKIHWRGKRKSGGGRQRVNEGAVSQGEGVEAAAVSDK